MSSVATPLRVGLVVLAAAAAFALGLTFIGGTKIGSKNSYRVFAVFDDATGLGVRTRVQVAGIPIGQVEKVELLQETAKARVWIRVKNDVVLHQDATVTKRAESILGDFLLDVYPGTASSPRLNDGDELRNVVRQPSMNDVFQQMSKITVDIQAITHSLRNVLAGEQGENNLKGIVEGLRRITESLEDTLDRSGERLDDTLANVQVFSRDLSGLMSGEKGDVREILKNTRDATAEARNILRTVGDMVGSNQGQLKESITGVKGTLDKLERTMSNVESITQKIDKGEGTVGRLVNDDRLIKNLESASKDISNLVGRADTLKIDVTVRSEFLFGRTSASGSGYNPWTKNYFAIRIAPKPDKWYGFELVDDPRGYTQRVEIKNTPEVIPNFPQDVLQTTTSRTLKFSGYIAKRYGPVSGRFGLLENTGGFGAKLHLLNDDLTISADAFEFSNPDKAHPRIKLYADYRFLGHLLITAGADDIFNVPIEDPHSPSRIVSGRDFFVGAGFFFTDEDLKLLISAIGLRF